MGHPINSRRSRHSARARPTAATRTSPPRSEAEGFAAAADVLARQGEQPTGGYGTPKPVARCVPGRAQRSKPGRADIVTPSAVERPRRESRRGVCFSRLRDETVHRELSRVGVRRYARQREDVDSYKPSPKK
jgi:hypothetical protein